VRLLKHEAVQGSIEGVCIEEEVVESRKDFQTLFNLMPDPVVIINSKGIFLEVNDRVEETTGFEKEELLGKNFLRTKIITEKDKAILVKNLAKRMLGMRIAPYEVEVLTKDGRKLPFEINATKIEYEGKPADLVILRDIIQRKKAEAALRESEEKFRNVAEQSPNMIFINKNGKVVYVNKKSEGVMGYKREEFCSPDFDFFTLIAPESKDIVKASFGKHVKGEDIAPYEYTLLTREGKRIEAIITTKLIGYEGESAILGIVTDITERKRMEEKLRQYSEHLEELIQERTENLLESETKYSVLVEEASDGVAILQNEKIVFVNKRLLEIGGYSRDELIGVPLEKITKMVDEKYRQIVKDRHKRRTKGEKNPATLELELIAKTGEHIPIEASSAIVHQSGHPAVLTIVRDIRERKKMEKQRLRLEKLAAIGEVTTMVGHDLRNPLQSIENATYYLNDELSHLQITQKIVEMLKVINDSVDYADKIIRDLQDFSAVSKPTLENNNINAIVKEILSQVETQENMELITKLGHLPEIKADKNMIKRVFLNLAMNGIQAIKEGGRLKVSTKKTKESVEIAFEDTGIGISKENKEKIFTPFFTTRAKGMGVGLAICKKFVESHGGSIEVESKEGKGSTFTVILPVP
jgi:PAS domain S-box-containing protein